jgi:Ca2+-transporting ATPase
LCVTLTLCYADLRNLGLHTPSSVENTNSLVFNTYVWMQIFNQINSRRLDSKFNVFEDILKNGYFFFITAAIICIQVLLVIYGGKALGTVDLSPTQWGCSLILGALTLPVGVLLRLIPDAFVQSLIPQWLKKKVKPKEIVSDFDEWDKGLLDIKDDLKFIKKIRGGRLKDLRHIYRYHRDTFRSWREAVLVSRSSSIEDMGVSTPVSEKGRKGPQPRDRLDSRSMSGSGVSSTGSVKRRRPWSRPSSISSAVSMPGVMAGSVAIASPAREQGPSLNADTREKSL